MVNTTKNVSNLTSTTLGQGTEPDRDGSRLVYLMVEVGIAIFGLIANTLAAATILSSKKLRRSVNNNLILNLSFSDLGILLLTFPFAVNIQEGSVWPKFVCLDLLPFSDVFQGVSFWTITAIAISRYRSVCGHFSIRQNTRKTKYLIAGIWLLSFLLISMPLIVFMKHSRTPIRDFCYVDFPEIKGHGRYLLLKIYTFTIRVTLNYVVPLAIVTTTYILAWVHISKGSRQLERIMREEHIAESSLAGIRIRSAITRNGCAKKLLTPLVLVFSISAFPFNLLRVLRFLELDISNYETEIAWTVSVVFFISHCAINPVIYCAVNPNFLQEMKSLLQKLFLTMQVLCSRPFSGGSHPVEFNRVELLG